MKPRKQIFVTIEGGPGEEYLNAVNILDDVNIDPGQEKVLYIYELKKKARLKSTNSLVVEE